MRLLFECNVGSVCTGIVVLLLGGETCVLFPLTVSLPQYYIEKMRWYFPLDSLMSLPCLVEVHSAVYQCIHILIFLPFLFVVQSIVIPRYSCIFMLVIMSGLSFPNFCLIFQLCLLPPSCPNLIFLDIYVPYDSALFPIYCLVCDIFQLENPFYQGV